MSKRIYKYVGPSYLGKVLVSPDRVTLKCSRPKDFNDPYELFLTINFKESPELLAFYSEVIGDLPQIPTTCFSRSPLVIPMWAHYAQNLTGLGIEFDEEKLAEHFPESGFGDVDYRDAPEEALSDLLNHTFVLQKFRYVHMLRQSVFSTAYYTKSSCWSYEQERRMLVDESETRSEAGIILADVPAECVTALICGPRASSETTTAVRERAEQLGCDFYMLRIGRTSPTPYLVDPEGRSHTFGGEIIDPCTAQCASCGEPVGEEDEHCSWCQIDSSHKQEAASRNSFRLLARYGLLEDYLRGMKETDERFSGRKK